MQPDEFVRTRQREWEQLSHFLQRAEREIRRLTPEEIDQLGQLYRATTSDLALAQRDFPTHRVTLYLNQLVGRAHATIYQEKPLAWRQLKTFALAGFPQLFRESLLFIFAAALLFLSLAFCPRWQPSLNPPPPTPFSRKAPKTSSPAWKTVNCGLT
ncbi:MAG: hypothetical protein IPL78_06115 [Chloroflexi bacterium]|nr:hypothetical protein [Chloroflexota bacterium]